MARLSYSFLKPQGSKFFPPLHSLAFVRTEMAIQRRGGPASSTGVFDSFFFVCFGQGVWDMLQNQITMGNRWLVEASLPSEQKPILPPTDQLRSLLTLPNSLSSSRARMRTSSGSYLSVWRYPCFYLEREGPQDYASGVAIRS